MITKKQPNHRDPMKKIPFISLGLALISIAGALIIGYAATASTIQNSRESYQKFYLKIASLVVQLAENRSKRLGSDLAKSIETIWTSLPDRPPDEYICIVDADSDLIVHTANPETVGLFCGLNPIFPGKVGGPDKLRDLVSLQQNYVGDYISSAGEEQIAAFVAIPEKQWIFGLHRSKNKFIDEIERDMHLLKLAFLLICALLMPLSYAMLFWTFYSAQNKRKNAEMERERLIEKLEKALEEIKTLKGIIPLCSFCKKIRNDKGFWEQVDVYISHHSDADISHSVCPDCLKKHYPNAYEAYPEVPELVPAPYAGRNIPR